MPPPPATVEPRRLAALLIPMLLGWPGAAQARDADITCSETLKAAPNGESVWAEWSVTDTDTAEVTVYAPAEAVEVTLEARLGFGLSETRWSTTATPLAASDTGAASLTIPDGAFPHALASDYVSDLLVTVTVTQNGEQGQAFSLPPAYVLWPEGEKGSPVIWSAADLAVHAPHGLLDPDGLFAEEAEEIGGHVRFYPPVHDLPRGTDLGTDWLDVESKTPTPERDETEVTP
jgi:hypothetical protein